MPRLGVAAAVGHVPIVTATYAARARLEAADATSRSTPRGRCRRMLIATGDMVARLLGRLRPRSASAPGAGRANPLGWDGILTPVGPWPPRAVVFASRRYDLPLAASSSSRGALPSDVRLPCGSVVSDDEPYGGLTVAR